MATYSEDGQMSFDYSRLKDRKYKAEDYNVDQTLADGPKEKRRCTDVLCAIGFIGVLCCTIWWCLAGYINGDPNALLAPVSGGRVICGTGEGAGYEYLYIPDISKALDEPLHAFFYGVCVKSCPEVDGSYTDVGASSLFYPNGNSDDTTVFPIYDTTVVFRYCFPVISTLPAS